MFALNASKNKLTLEQKAILTSGSSNVYDMQFNFNADWDGLERVAVFRVGTINVSVSLNDTTRCKLPWECTQDEFVGQNVYAGVYGMSGETIILPTIWCCLGMIVAGAKLGEEALPKTPTLAEQFLAQVVAEREAAEEAKEDSEEAKEDATTAANKAAWSAEAAAKTEQEVKEAAQAIINEADARLAAIQTEGDTQVERVTQEGADQIALAKNCAEQAVEYSELSVAAADRAEKLAQQVGVNSGLQADWEENDPAAAGYIHGRTHWVEPVFTEIITDVEPITNISGEYYRLEDEQLGLVDGDTYLVTYNGVDYDCVCDSWGSSNYSFNRLGDGAGRDYPFDITVDYRDAEGNAGLPENHVNVHVFDNPSSVVISIKHYEGENVYPLPAKFMRLTSPNGTVYELTVANDGTLSTTLVTE